jgi:hypothetical protein
MGCLAGGLPALEMAKNAEKSAIFREIDAGRADPQSQK